MRKYEIELKDNNKLYFLPEYNRFALNDLDFNIEPNYYDTSLVKLRLEISHLCNGRCKYCLVYGNNVEKMEVLNIEEFWRYLNKQEWFKHIKKIFIIGGEPLLHFEEICYIMDNFNGKVSFSTNGTLLNDEMAKKLCRPNVKVFISLDGPNFEDNVNRVYSDGKYMYPDIIRGINLLKKYNVRFGIFMVASLENINRAKDIIMELDTRYNPMEIGYSLPHWTPDYEYSFAEEYRDVMISLYKNRKKINAEISQLKWRIDPICDGKIKKFSCALHTTQTTILPDKSIVRCSKIDNEHDNLKDIITNELLDKNSPLELAKNPENACSSCVATASCGGGCPFDGMKRFNCLTDKRECIITPAIINLVLEDITEALNNNTIDVSDGLIEPEIINQIIWS